MNNVYLDCSGFPRSISINKGDLPNSIYIDGQEFTQKLDYLLDRLHNPPEKTKEEKRWELVLALAGNSAMIVTKKIGKNIGNYTIEGMPKETAKNIADFADAIIKKMENEKCT